MRVLSIVIPAYNEERFIATLLQQIRDLDLTSLGFTKEVIVVDDCSRDRTAEIVEEKRPSIIATMLSLTTFFVGFVAAPDWRLALMFLAVPLFFNYFYLSPSVALVQETVRPQERVLAGALLLLVMNLVGLGLGPTLLGAVSDFLKATHPEHSLQLAFYALVPFYVLAVLCFLWLARAFRPDARGGVSA